MISIQSEQFITLQLQVRIQVNNKNVNNIETSPSISKNGNSSFSDKYHSLFTEVMKTKAPQSEFWTKYKESNDKKQKKLSDTLDIKTIQFRLEQQKSNYKNEFPFTHHSIKADKALVTLRRSLDSNSNTIQKNKNYYYKKDVLNLLSPEKEKNVNCITETYQRKKFDQDKYPSDFYKKLKKKFPDFVMGGYLKNTFYIDKSDNMRFAKMKREINKIFS